MTGPSVPPRLINELVELEKYLDALTDDPKLKCLVGLLRDLGKKRKALIFSEAVATVKYLAEQIGGTFRNDKVRFIIGETPDAERREILKAFPESIDVLISSNASSEGVDLPGAQLVVNYDLSWTPLTLAQRIGRIDRPQQQPHKVKVRNFYPGAGSFDQLVGLGERLESRAMKLKSITMAEVFGNYTRLTAPSREDELGLVRALYEQEGFDWGSLEGFLPTPEYLRVWLAASTKQLRAAASLPDGVQCGEQRGTSACYVLVRHEDRAIALIKDRKTGTLRQAPGEVSHERLVHEHIFAKHDALGIELPPSFDDEVAETVRTWAATNKINPEDLIIVASKHIGQ